MRYLFLLISFLFAYEANILSVNKDIAVIDKYVKKGVSGVVVCKYLDKNIICARAISLGKKVKLTSYDNLKNSAFANPLVYIKKGDKVIFAKNYDRILIIAPNQEAYLKVKKIYKDFHIIPSDLLAVFNEEINLKTLKEFTKIYDVGRFIFVADKIYEVDANSFNVVFIKKFQNYKKGFFTYYKTFKLDWRIKNGHLIIKG